MFTRVMARAYAFREQLTVSEWAAKWRTITLGDAPGPWRNERTPYLRGVMDAFGEDGVRTITIKKGSQTGGTEAIYNMIFWAVTNRPGLIMFIYPDADSAADQNTLRFLPACRETIPIRDLLSPRAHDLKSGSLKFLTCSLLFRGAFSEHKIESLPAPYVITDELDRCPPRTAHLAAQRGKTYTNAKVVYNGKPGMKGLGIDAEYEKSDKRVYAVPCPHCGCYHERRFDNVRWRGRAADGKETWDTRDLTADTDQVAATASIKCMACKGRIGAEFNHWQLRRGRWVAEGQRIENLRELVKHKPDRRFVESLDEADERWGQTPGAVVGTPKRRAAMAGGTGGGHAGFHIPELISGLIPNPYAPAARAFVENGGRLDPDFMADHLGEAWSPVGMNVEVASLRALATKASDGGYRLGTVPEECRLLLATIDVQESSAYVEVRAYGAFGKDRWLVWHEHVACPDTSGLVPLDGVLYHRVFKTPSGRVVKIHLRAIDSGDRTEEVYRYCLARPRIVAVKGQGTDRGGRQPDYLHKWKRLEVYPDGTKMRGTVHLLHVNTHVWKSVVQRRLRLAGKDTGQTVPTDEAEHTPAEFMVGVGGAPAGTDAGSREGLRNVGAWRFPEDTSDEYFTQITAEECLRVVEGSRTKFVWRLREGRRDNHYFDCAVYSECLADAVGVRGMQAAAATPAAMDVKNEPDAPREREQPRSLGQGLVERARENSLLRKRR